MLTSYVCQTEYTSMGLIDEEMTGYLRLTAEQQSLTGTLGLTMYLNKAMNDYITETIQGD